MRMSPLPCIDSDGSNQNWGVRLPMAVANWSITSHHAVRWRLTRSRHQGGRLPPVMSVPLSIRAGRQDRYEWHPPRLVATLKFSNDTGVIQHRLYYQDGSANHLWHHQMPILSVPMKMLQVSLDDGSQLGKFRPRPRSGSNTWSP